MRQLSSTSTRWHKKGFPITWFGGLGLFTLAWIPGVITQEVPAFTLLLPLGMALFGYVLMRFLIFPLLALAAPRPWSWSHRGTGSASSWVASALSAPCRWLLCREGL